jgi:hypothetical protein
MCLAIAIRPGCEVDRKTVERGFIANPDGAGLMYVHEGQVRIAKGFRNVDALWIAYLGARKAAPESWIVLHMRIATSGKTDEDNCHPFALGTQAGFAHNGIIRGMGDKEHSDTWELCYGVLARLPEMWWRNAGIEAMVEHIAKESASKFVLLTVADGVRIYNEDAGYWQRGVWYSNYSGEVKVGFARGKWFGDEVDFPIAKGKGYEEWTGEEVPGMEVCDWCGDVFEEEDLEEYQGGLVCWDCLRELRASEQKTMRRGSVKATGRKGK